MPSLPITIIGGGQLSNYAAGDLSQITTGEVGIAEGLAKG